MVEGIPEGWIAKKEAIELTALSPRTFDRTIKRRRIEHREYTVPNRRPIVVYLRTDIQDISRKAIPARPEVISPEETETQPEQQTDLALQQDTHIQELPSIALISALTTALRVPRITEKLVLTLAESVAYSGVPKSTILTAIHDGSLAVIRKRPYGIRRDVIDTYVSALSPVSVNGVSA